jgi:hypothetical protein
MEKHTMQTHHANAPETKYTHNKNKTDLRGQKRLQA